MKRKPNELRNALLTAIFVPLIAFIFFTYADSKPKEITDITIVSVDDIGEYKPFYIENLQIVKRYAFKTVDSYTDSDGYSDNSYYAYRADDPMDEYELFEEYYIVVFTDISGSRHLASMTVRPYKSKSVDFNSSDGNLMISACVSATGEPENTLFLNSYDKKILQFRDEAIANYAKESSIPYEGINMVYQCETIEEYYDNK